MNSKELLQSLYELQIERDKLLIDKRGIELELIKLKRRVQTSGRLPQNEYDSICKKQDILRQKHLQIEQSGASLNIKIKQKELMLNDSEIIIVKNDINKNLIELRKKYIDFASDSSRVNSMRTMAAQFIDEIDNILK